MEYGSSSSDACRYVPGAPRCTVRTVATPGTSCTACLTAATFAASGTTMSVGALSPLGNDFDSSSWPWTDSTSPRNELPCVRPDE